MAWSTRALHIVLILLSLLAGCATVIVGEDEPGALSAQQIVTPEEMKFIDLALNKTVSTAIDARSPRYIIDGASKRIASFAIPDGRSQLYIDYFSLPYGGIMLSELKTLIPAFIFLDASHKVAGFAGSGPMLNRSTEAGTIRFGGRVAVPRGARYAIIYGINVEPNPLIAYGSSGYSALVPGSQLGLLRLTLSDIGMATVADSGASEDSNKARIFYLASVDGVAIPNASGASRRASSGQGFHLTTVFPTRFVPAKPLKVVVVGTHATGAPIHSIASMLSGTFWSVEAELDFTPEVDKAYVVRGNLEKDNSTVWIEDAATGQLVTKRGTSRDQPNGR